MTRGGQRKRNDARARQKVEETVSRLRNHCGNACSWLVECHVSRGIVLRDRRLFPFRLLITSQWSPNKGVWNYEDFAEVMAYVKITYLQSRACATRTRCGISLPLIGFLLETYAYTVMVHVTFVVNNHVVEDNTLQRGRDVARLTLKTSPGGRPRRN